MMYNFKIKPFQNIIHRTKFYSATAYISGSRAAIMGKYGHFIMLSPEFVDSLAKQQIPGLIRSKLESRCFIEESDGKDGNLFHKCRRQVCPEFFMVDLTNSCNMRCKYCLRNVGTFEKSISRKALADICDYIVAYCEKHHLKDISVQPWGGEPLLKLNEILFMRERICPEGTNVHFSVETNGLLLSENMLDILYENKIGIGISIDGTKEFHDAQRVGAYGAGTHEIVERNLIRAVELYGDRLGTITTVTKKNVGGIEDILEYYAVKLGLTNVKFNFVHESMFSDCSELCLDTDEIADATVRIMKKIVELNERGYHISEYNMKTKLKNILYLQYSDICHSQGCCGGRKMIVFDREGMIYPCEFTDTPEESIGSIYDDVDLIDIVSGAMVNRDFFIPKRVDICKACDWYVFCRGGCTVRVISTGKRPPAIDDVECAVNRSLYPALVELILDKSEVVNQIMGADVVDYTMINAF